MMFILDTNAASDPVKPRRSAKFATWLAEADPATICLPVTAIAELEYGVAFARRAGSPNVEAVEPDVLRVTRTAQILDLDQQAAPLPSRMWAEPSLRNFTTTQSGARKVQRGSDLQIAAITLRHDATLVTRNVHDFQRIGVRFSPLRLYDPCTGVPR